MKELERKVFKTQDEKKATKFNNLVNPPLVAGLDDQNILGDLFIFLSTMSTLASMGSL